jgi:hypothetical protein
MSGQQETFSIVSRKGIPNSRGKSENFSISKEEMESLLEEKPQGFSRSRYWSYLIKKGNSMLKREKDIMLTLKRLAEKHNEELVMLLEMGASFDEVLGRLETQQEELDKVAASSLEEA